MHTCWLSLCVYVRTYTEHVCAPEYVCLSLKLREYGCEVKSPCLLKLCVSRSVRDRVCVRELLRENVSVRENMFVFKIPCVSVKLCE